MRRPIVLLSLLLVAAFSALVMAGPAGAAHLSPRVLCPQANTCCPTPPASQDARAHVTPVCCQQTTACCPSGTCCSAATCCTATACPSGSLTISASPNPSTAPGKVTVSGVLTTSPAAGVTVALWREQAGQSSFHQLTMTTTDSSGHYTFTLKRGTVMADQAWYATAGSLRSATIDQQVRALVGLASSSHTPVAGSTIALHGIVSPSHAGAVVLIEQRRGSTWRVIARPRLSKGSGYSISHRFARAGKTELRAVLARSTRNLASTSPTVTLTVRS